MFGTGLGYLCHFKLKFETNIYGNRIALLTICQTLLKLGKS